MGDFKEKLKRKLEKNTVKSVLDGETIYLSKGSILSWLPLGIGDWFKEWHQTYVPIDENEKVLWVNVLIGGWRNFIKLILILLIVGMALMQFVELFNYIGILEQTQCQNITIGEFVKVIK